MKNKSVGTRGVIETAEAMGVSKGYVVKAGKNILRKLRWPNRMKAVTRFLNEYSKKSS